MTVKVLIGQSVSSPQFFNRLLEGITVGGGGGGSKGGGRVRVGRVPFIVSKDYSTQNKLMRLVHWLWSEMGTESTDS